MTIQEDIDWSLRELLSKLTGEDCDATLYNWSKEIRRVLDLKRVEVRIPEEKKEPLGDTKYLITHPKHESLLRSNEREDKEEDKEEGGGREDIEEVQYGNIILSFTLKLGNGKTLMMPFTFRTGKVEREACK